LFKIWVADNVQGKTECPMDKQACPEWSKYLERLCFPAGFFIWPAIPSVFV
jgi:hypothetical protein